ncbi:unnamed protein product [Anisakis simplex]|uniref:Solute carrier family 12 member 9 n=1 Tax=Anisakis simplex TaxID=6269 RepID=A0A3P6TGV5_ANISI|nr:unnamed protein product [Anisakis simplex]
MGCVIVLLASLVTTITALSTCAICTNGDVKGGGAYFLISRSLGPEFGGSIGLIFSVANAVGAAMYVVGFSETVRDLLKDNGIVIVDGEMNDVRIIGMITCTLLMGIIFIGTQFESKMQIGLLAILALSILDYMIGSFVPIPHDRRRLGLTGYSFVTMSENFKPNFEGETFFSVFSVYFPAATGIMAGANISGDLLDPQKAIPKGTLLAIGVTTVIYLMVIWMTGSTCVRYADGLVLPVVVNGTHLIPDCLTHNATTRKNNCLYGLMKNYHAVCKDRLFPKIGVFAKGYGKDEEPRRAYALAFGIAMIMILIGQCLVLL